METYRRINLSELEEIAPVWGFRNSSILKVSFFKGIKAPKPYVLLFTILPQDNSFFDPKSIFKKNEVEELMDTCLDEEKHQFTSAWYVFVKYGEDYFNINSLSPCLFGTSSRERNTIFLLDDECNIELCKKTGEEFYSYIVL